MDIYKILNINPGTFSDFPLLANRVADYQTEKVVSHNIDKLMRIKNEMSAGDCIQVNQQSIDSIISKAKSAARKQDYDISQWSIRELRIISYYLMEMKNDSEYYFYALKLLRDNWRDLYFNGILFYLMNSWNSIEKEYRELTCQLVCDKLKQYNGTNKRYLNLKNHVNFLDENGPTRMATLVHTQHKQITEAPQILGFKSSTICQSYYSDVILKFVKLYNIDDFDLLNQIFELHNLDRTKKLVFAHLVEKADDEKDGIKQSALCRYINRVLGDVTLPTTWAPFLGATNEDAKKLQHAMQLVNIWFTQQFIETFFEECVQDKARERFWLSYVSYISKFKIVGSAAIKTLLQNNAKIGSVFTKHFIQTNSYSSQTSALVLYIKDKVMVEFSDTGALYVYNHDHQQAKLIAQKYRYISSTNDLKLPTISLLIEPNNYGGYYYRDEGRMTHRGDWQTRLNGWMYRNIIQNKDFSSDAKINEIFSVKPFSVDIEKDSLERFNKEISETEKRRVSENENPRHIADLVQKHDIPAENSKPHTNSEPQKKQNRQINDSPVHKSLDSIKPIINSKRLRNNMRIVADNKAFYLYNPETDSNLLIQNHSFQNNLGNIWLKKTYLEDWYEIVHFYREKETTVAFLRTTSNGALIKEDLNLSGKKKLKFK